MAAAPTRPITPMIDAAECQDITAIRPAVSEGRRHLSQIAGKVVGAKRPTRARPFVSCGDEAGGNRVLGARADAAQNKRYREHGDARARAEEEIGRCCRSGAGRKNSDAANPLRRPGDRNLQPGHHAGIKCAQKADRGIAQRELSLPQRQKHIERIGKAVMQRVGAAGHPEYARSVCEQAWLQPRAQ